MPTALNCISILYLIYLNHSQAVTDEVFAVTTSQGSLSLYKCPRNEDDTFNRIEHTSTKHLHNLR